MQFVPSFVTDVKPLLLVILKHYIADLFTIHASETLNFSYLVNLNYWCLAHET